MDEAFEAALTTALQIHDIVPWAILYRLSQHCQCSSWTHTQLPLVVTQTNGQHSPDKVGMSVTALFYCCDPDLRTYIMCDLRGDVANMVKVDLPAAIKKTGC